MDAANPDPLSHPPPDPSNASISRRDYFYPLPHPLPAGTPIPYSLGLPDRNPLGLLEKPVEPTHTLVLTSTRKVFVDVRIFRPILEGDEEGANAGGPRKRLDWAFAGSSSSVPIADPFPRGVVEHHAEGQEGKEKEKEEEGRRTWPGPVTHASWTHWLDSHHALPLFLSPAAYSASIPPDEGTMFPLTPAQTLEFGQALNSKTGQMCAYEEFWTDLPIEETTREGEEGLKFSIVLRLDEPSHGVRGLIIRLGRYCQGIVMKDEYCTVERWQYFPSKVLHTHPHNRDFWGEVKEAEAAGKGEGKEAGEWERVVKIGDQFLPCATTFEPEILVEGGTVKYWDYVWRCEEKVVWRDGVVVVDEQGE